MKPKRIQQQRRKGWRKPPNTALVSRPSKWGNPFNVDTYGRDQAVALYRDWITTGGGRKLLIDRLRGKNLACFCSLDVKCHADVLLEIANRDHSQCGCEVIPSSA